jgi:hypothetical protein
MRSANWGNLDRIKELEAYKRGLEKAYEIVKGGKVE